MDIAIFDLGLYDPSHGLPILVAEEAMETAQMAEQLGFQKIWISEHHTNDVAWRSTEIVLTLLAGSTSTISVGAAGVLARYHEPLFTAQNFLLLNHLFNGRIDLGFSKGTITGELNKQLRSHKDSFEYSDKILLTKQLINSELLLNQSPLTQVPDLWMMGSSLETLEFAGNNDFNCCLSLCHDSASFPRISQAIDKYNLLRDKLHAKGLRLGLLITFLIDNNVESNEILCQPSVYNNLEINFSGNSERIEKELTQLTGYLKPDLLVLANIYRASSERHRHMTLFSSFVQKSKL